MNFFKKFLKILLINIIASAIPFGYVGMVFGLPSTILSALVIAYIITS